MTMYPNPVYTEATLRNDRDRTLRAAEQYELQRAFRELAQQRREKRKDARTLRKMERGERRHEFVQHLRLTRGRA
ncbi:MAG TPA: hypothetical protein VIP98_09155 [Microlunatus sp.]